MSRGWFAPFTARTMLNSLVSADSSPLRKKQRMSSPIFPGFIEDLSPEDLRSLSEIDATVSQSNHSAIPLLPPQPTLVRVEGLQTSQPARDKRRTSELSPGARNDPLTVQTASTSIQLPTTVGFTSVRATVGNISNKHYRSPSPEDPPPEQDYDSWFNAPSADVPAFVGFQSASATNSTGFVGFTSVGKAIPLEPSEDALEKLKQRMKAWEADTEEEFSYILPPTPQIQTALPPGPVTPTKPPSNSDQNPTSPTPTFRPIPSQQTAFTKQKAFKPPLLSNRTNLTSSVPASPSNVAQLKGSVPQFKPPLLSSASTSTLPKPSTPSRATSDSAFRTPVRLGGTHRPGSVKKFTTPFKPGMRPGDPGRGKLQEDLGKKSSQETQKDQVHQIQMNYTPRKPSYGVLPSSTSPPNSRKGKGKAKEYRFFDLSQSDFCLSVVGSGG